MKARTPLSNKVKAQINEYYKQLDKENIVRLYRLFSMIACEVMITEYGFGPKRIPEFADKLNNALFKITDVYEDSTEFKIRRDLKDLGYDFDGEWSKWEEKMKNG